MKKPRTRTCAYFILIWIWRGHWLITGQWSPLSHASHCLTTSRPAAATQTRVRVKTPPYNPRYFLHLPQSSLFLGSGTCSKCAGLRVLVRQHIVRNFLAVNDSTYSHGNWPVFHRIIFTSLQPICHCLQVYAVPTTWHTQCPWKECWVFSPQF